MKYLKFKTVFLAALTLAGCAVWTGPAAAVSAESTSVSASQKTVIVLDSSKGATADSLQKALMNSNDPNYKTNGRTVIRLVGNFTIDKTISLYNGAEIDATNAVITGKNTMLFVSYSKSGNIIRGGKWNLDSNSMLIKLSASSDNLLQSLTVNGGCSTQYGSVFLYKSTNTVIRDCRFNKTLSQVICVYSGHDVTILNNSFNQADGHGVYIYGGCNDENGNVSDLKAWNMSVLGNTVNHINGDGIKCVRCGNNCTISGNIVKNITLNETLDYDPLRNAARSGVGIMVMECDGMKVGSTCEFDGRTYSGNTVTNTENYGMHVNLCTNTKIINSSFTRIGTNGIHNSASAATIVKFCTFEDCGDVGIFLTPGPVSSVAEYKRTAKNSVIRNNKISQCGTMGIELSKTANASVSTNTIVRCGDYGIYCIGARNINIVNNATGNTKVNDGSGIGYNSECSDLKFSNNRRMEVVLNRTAFSLGKTETYQLKATVKNGTDNTVNWRTSDSKVLTVTTAGKVKAVGTGTAWITARSADGVEASCKITVKNAPSSVSMTNSSLTMGVGEKYTLTSSVNSGAASAKRTYRTSSSILRMDRIDWQAEFTAVAAGSAYVTVRTYNGKEANCKVTVKEAPEWVAVNQKTMTLKVGQTASLYAVIANSAGCAVRTFRTSDSSVIKMTKTNWTGEFKAMKAGVAWVTVRTYNGKEASCKITVTP